VCNEPFGLVESKEQAATREVASDALEGKQGSASGSASVEVGQDASISGI
jgi:hypothetical protein